MKGGRLHRPEPPLAHIAAAEAPAAPSDDWVDGSWTVDCSCGVTFDDGEEMVSCDECSLWVHTRCARYVRSVHASFSCHRCRRSRCAPSSADEAEVAELLAELPTHRPTPLYRRWAEIPLPARVHVHGLPGGGDAALFRGAPAFSAALWRCTGYVPKRFGFRYCEFPSWAENNDGADALFALAREKRRETSEVVPIGVERKEKHYARSLSCRGKAGGGHEAVSSLTVTKKRGSDTFEGGCQESSGPDHAETTMTSSDSQAVKTKKMEEPMNLSMKKKNTEEVSGTLNKDEQVVPLKLEGSSGVKATSSLAEQEGHSLIFEVTKYKEQSERNDSASLRFGITSSGLNKMKDMQGLQKQSNQTSNLQDVSGASDLHIKPQIIKTEPSFHENGTAECIQIVSDGHESNKQALGDAACSSVVQRDSSNLTYGSVCSERPKSETQNLMHTVPENLVSIFCDAKVSSPFSGSISVPCELSHSLVSKQPSSARSIDRSTKKGLVSPNDSKHDSGKFSEGSSQEVTRRSEKVQLKGSLPSAPKSSQASRIHVPTVKPRLPVPKEQSQKTPITGGTSARSFHGEMPPLQSRNKAVASSSSQKKDKTHHRVNVTQEGSDNSTSTELRASDLTAPLSDEQLALLLHQQLNSSPRVPRVPRCHQSAGTQVLHPTGATVFSKRSSSHGARDHAVASKKRNREDPLKDAEDTRRTENVSFVDRRQRDSSTEHVPFVKDTCIVTENIAQEQKKYNICSTAANTGFVKDDLIDNSVSPNLPELIDEIISKNRNIAYGELCDAIHQALRKPNVEDFAHGSYLHVINDCLRKKGEWAHLVDQASKTNSNKRPKGESDSLMADPLEAENMINGPEKDSEEGSVDLHLEDLPRGKRKSRKRRRLELKGRRVRDKRKRSNISSSSEDAAATLSDSSSGKNDTLMDDVRQEDNCVAPENGG